MAKTGGDLQLASKLLKGAKVVAIPTETVYGLAANAFDPEAVIGIFEIKNRPRFNPLIVHAGSWNMINEVATEFPEVFQKLAEKFWPGPLTLLVPKTERIHPLVTAGSHLVGLRVPDHPLTLELLNMLDFPLAAPSANLFGKISPTTVQHVESQLGDRLEYILDGGDCKIGVESTIIKLDIEGRVVILRHGGVPAESIAEITGYAPLEPDGRSIEAPGMLNSHYAPRLPLYVGDLQKLISRHEKDQIAIISFDKPHNSPNITKTFILSPRRSLHEAAHNLFSAMHDAENSGAEIILAEKFPDEGIGMAINDRLKRASS